MYQLSLSTIFDTHEYFTIMKVHSRMLMIKCILTLTSIFVYKLFVVCVL